LAVDKLMSIESMPSCTKTLWFSVAEARSETQTQTQTQTDERRTARGTDGGRTCDGQHGVALDLQFDVLRPRERTQRLEHAALDEHLAEARLRAQVADAHRADALTGGVVGQQVRDEQVVAARLDDRQREVRLGRAQVRQQPPGLALHFDVLRAHHGDGGAHGSFRCDHRLIRGDFGEVREGGAGLRGDDHVGGLRQRDQRRQRARLDDFVLVLVADGQVRQGRHDLAENLHVVGRQQMRQRRQGALLRDLHFVVEGDRQAAQRGGRLLVHVGVGAGGERDERLDAARLHDDRVVRHGARQVRQRAAHVVLRHEVGRVAERQQRLDAAVLDDRHVVRRGRGEVGHGQDGVASRLDLVQRVQREVDERSHGAALDDFDLCRDRCRQVRERQRRVSLTVQLMRAQRRDEAVKRALVDEDLVHVRVDGEVGEATAGLAATVRVLALRQRYERRNAALLDEAAVELLHFHQVGRSADGVALDDRVALDHQADDGAHGAVRDLHLVFLDGRQVVQRGGDLAKDGYVLGATHQHERVEDSLAHDDRAELGADTKTAQRRNGLALCIKILAARQRHQGRYGVLFNDALAMVRVCGEIRQGEGSVPPALHVLAFEHCYQCVYAF
jgi:hypothetical protein